MPDDGHPWPFRVASDLEAAADGIAARKVAARQLLVDERDELTVGRVGRGDRAAADEPLAHRLEVSVGDDLPVALRVRARRRNVAFDHEAEVADGRTERKQPRRARRPHARQRPHAVDQPLVEPDDLFRARIARLPAATPSSSARSTDRSRWGCAGATRGCGASGPRRRAAAPPAPSARRPARSGNAGGRRRSRRSGRRP